MHHKKLLSIGIMILLGLLLSITFVSGDNYFNSKSGVSFIVPDSWKQLELNNDDRKFVEAKFKTSNDDVIIFGSGSLYESMNNLGIDIPSNQETKLINYRITNDNISEIYGDLSVLGDYIFKTFKGVQWLYYETENYCGYQQAINGNLIMFLTNVNINPLSQQELEKIIIYITESELIKEEQNVKNITEANLKDKQEEFDEGITGGIFIVLICSLVILLIPRTKYINCPVCDEKNNSNNRYCKKCGNKLR